MGCTSLSGVPQVWGVRVPRVAHPRSPRWIFVALHWNFAWYVSVRAALGDVNSHAQGFYSDAGVLYITLMMLYLSGPMLTRDHGPEPSYEDQPPVCCMYRRHRAACPWLPTHSRCAAHAYQPRAYRTHRVPYAVHHRSGRRIDQLLRAEFLHTREVLAAPASASASAFAPAPAIAPASASASASASTSAFASASAPGGAAVRPHLGYAQPHVRRSWRGAAQAQRDRAGAAHVHLRLRPRAAPYRNGSWTCPCPAKTHCPGAAQLRHVQLQVKLAVSQPPSQPPAWRAVGLRALDNREPVLGA